MDNCLDKNFYRYKGKIYPNYLKKGGAVKYIAPLASEFCKGKGLDIGGDLGNGWVLPGAQAVNIKIDNEWDAYSLPEEKYDYIFSSHTLEHLADPIGAIEYWKGHLLDGGVLFLYLPHPDMTYWRPQFNRKHLHLFYPEDVRRLLEDLGFCPVLCSERDLLWSFAAVGIK